MGETETIKSSHLCGCVVSICLVIQLQGTMLIEAENKGEFILKKKNWRMNKKKDTKVGNLTTHMVVKEYLFKVNIIDIQDYYFLS